MSPRDPSRSTTRRHRDHNNSGATRELVRFLAAEGLNSKEALRVLGRTSDRLDYETRRANETEQRLRETQERWRAVNQARIAAQQEAGRLNEELRLHKTQLETAQAQIARANDMIAVSDREKLRAEEAAEKAKEQARRLQEERVAHRARGEGRKIGRDEGWMQGREAGYNEAEDLVSPDSYDQPPTSARPNGSVSGDVEVNVNAPDVAPIMHSAPLQTVATPLPQSEISQAMYQPRAPSRSSRAGSILQQQLLQQQLQQNGNGGGEGMPEPNFNPDPRTVRPISVRNSSPTLTHPHVEVPPDGWIPSADADGTIGLPPPHELSQAIPSPRGSPASSHRRLEREPDLAGGAIPPPPPPAPLKEPISRDYGYHREREREPVNLPESTTSTATNQFDLLSNAPLSASHRGERGERGMERGERGLSAIPEQRESRHGTPKSSGTGRRMSAASGHNHEFASNAAYEYGDGGEQGRGQRPRDRSQRIADELRYSNPDGGPSVHEPVSPLLTTPFLNITNSLILSLVSGIGDPNPALPTLPLLLRPTSPNTTNDATPPRLARTHSRTSPCTGGISLCIRPRVGHGHGAAGVY
ncbi:hypothetical protein BD410DRAFT_873014 [Rickenella mellea]|uniref:Uncharacterized protein n=1 Tax=Rickenella mellea TaxID=50990 RepID=A0A4Y7PZJ6_9AGAM|nr:hypothetical protein BD410DRAFT_873014 [Rickenella mellea]